MSETTTVEPFANNEPQTYGDLFNRLCTNPSEWPNGGMCIGIGTQGKRHVLDPRRSEYVYRGSFGERTVASASPDDSLRWGYSCDGYCRGGRRNV